MSLNECKVLHAAGKISITYGFDLQNYYIQPTPISQSKTFDYIPNF